MKTLECPVCGEPYPTEEMTPRPDTPEGILYCEDCAETRCHNCGADNIAGWNGYCDTCWNERNGWKS